MAVIHAAWMEHLVLVFPGQQPTDEQFVDFAGNFGELEVFHQKIIRSQRVPQIFRVANIDEDGKLLPPGNLTVRQLCSAQLWHSDSSSRPVPSPNPITGSCARRQLARVDLGQRRQKLSSDGTGTTTSSPDADL